MAPRSIGKIRGIGFATILVLGLGLSRTPSLLAQSPASIQVSATVISVSPALEAIQQVRAHAQRLASLPVTAQRALPERSSTSDRLIQLRTVAGGRGETPDQTRMLLEYAGN